MISPENIPPMACGLAVPPFDLSITKCGYCGRNLEWKQVKNSATEESWAREQQDRAKGIALLYAYGPPRISWTYGCPRYGEPFKVTEGVVSTRRHAMLSDKPWLFGQINGWHFHWWESLV